MQLKHLKVDLPLVSEEKKQERRRLLKPDEELIGSLSTFMKKIEELQEDPDFVYFFRGHGYWQWGCEPALYRDAGYIKNEDILFKEMILRCPTDFNQSGSTFEMLVKMQHYSLPTRLLDITTNALVALFFACSGKKEARDIGEVVVFRVPRSFIRYYDSDRVSAVANIARRPSDFVLPETEERDKFNRDSQIHDLIHDIRREKPYFEPYIVPNHLGMVHCVKPKLDNPRIIRQDGAFFLFGINERKQQPAAIEPGWYLRNISKKRLLIAPTEGKTEIKGKERILSQLAKLGISHSTLFPEVDSVAKHISELYGVKS
ncbi:FRG domain-containing protein [Aquabacterium sp.]|uniref:FRG domain-containing protein n=1 Tax=Aquabacterium sp. TaxID=1872578 RepID=UPI003D6D08C2